MNLLDKVGFKNLLLIIGALLILIIGIDSRCTGDKLRETQAALERTQINLKASQDSIRLVKDKAGKDEYDKLSYIAKDLKELKEVNADLAKEVAITKGKVAAIQKAGYKIAHDTIWLETEVRHENGIVSIDGNYDTTFSAGNYRKLKTETKYNTEDSSAIQKVTQDELGFTAVTGLKQTDKGYEIFVKPQYPGLTLTSLEGAVIENNLFKQSTPKPKLITVGLHVGWTPLTYDFIRKKGGLNLSQIGGGVGLNFNLSRIIK